MEMITGSIVENNRGEVGVVAAKYPWWSREEDGEPVVYDGTDVVCGAPASELKVVGQYEASISNPDKCGLHLGQFTCRYLSLEGGEFACQRFSPLRLDIIMRDTNAKGQPKGLFPKCQDEIMQAATRATTT